MNLVPRFLATGLSGALFANFDVEKALEICKKRERKTEKAAQIIFNLIIA
jgi:hypothetical protein